MKNISFIIVTSILFTFSLTSCRNTNQSDPKKDVVEDLNDVMEPVEEEVEELIQKDSLFNKTKTKEDSVKILK